MSAAPNSFGTHVKPYFSALFRAHMLDAANLDLWDPDVVKDAFDDIRGRINKEQDAAGVMPPRSLWGTGIWDKSTRDHCLADMDAWKDGGFQP